MKKLEKEQSNKIDILTLDKDKIDNFKKEKDDPFESQHFLDVFDSIFREKLEEYVDK